MRRIVAGSKCGAARQRRFDALQRFFYGRSETVALHWAGVAGFRRLLDHIIRATGLVNPHRLLFLPNGDLLAGEKSVGYSRCHASSMLQ